MNRKEWIDYFEAINNRKPTIQECQQALQNGEFVMEGRQATFSNNGNSVPAGAMPLPNQMLNQPYAQQMVFVKKKKFGKKTFIGLGIALFLVLATSLGVFLFSSKGTNLGGLWVNGNNTALVYELNGKKSKLFTGYREDNIKEVTLGKKVRQEFERSIKAVSDSKLKSIADFDKKYQFHTKEIILVKTERYGYYNLVQKDGTNVILDIGLSEVFSHGSNTKEFKKRCLFYKAEVPKAFVGNWKKFDEDDDAEGKATISENGVISADSDDIDIFLIAKPLDILIAKPLKEYLEDQSGSVDNGEVQKEFAKVQKSLKSHGYQVKSVNDIYHNARKSYYYVLVDGGKRIIILEGFNHLSYTGYFEREDK